METPLSASDEHLKNLLARDDFHVIVAILNQKLIGGLVAYELAKYRDETAEMFLFEMGVDEAQRRKSI